MSFASGVWLHFCGRFMTSPPPDLQTDVAWCQRLHGPLMVSTMKVMKLLLQVIVYYLWRERNIRIFHGTSMTPPAFFRVIDRAMRDRFLSFPSASASSPSLLQFYFCFISPYS